jgi:hypothetical protein
MMESKSTDYEINFLNQTRPYVNRYVQKYKKVNIFDKALGQDVWNGIWDEMAKAQRLLPIAKHQTQAQFQLLHRYEYLVFLRFLFWTQQGKTIFHFSGILLDLFEKAEVEQLKFNELGLPHKSFYISLIDKDVFLYPDEDGNKVYANGALITQAKDNEIDVFFFGRIKNEAAYQNRKWFFHPEYKIGYTLEFERPHTTVKESLVKFKHKLRNNYDDSGVTQRMENTVSNLKLILNCIRYLSHESRDIIGAYPKDIPVLLLEKLKKSKTESEQTIVEAEIQQLGYGSILFCGQKYKSS